MNKTLLTVCLYSEKALPHLRQWENEMFDKIIYKHITSTSRIYIIKTIQTNIDGNEIWYEVIYCVEYVANLCLIPNDLATIAVSEFGRDFRTFDSVYYSLNKILMFGNFSLEQISKWKSECKHLENQLKDNFV